MLDTGFPRADVENDFPRARRHQILATLAHRLRRQPPTATASCRSTRSSARSAGAASGTWACRRYRLDTIVGTVDSRRDFDRHFRPTSNRVRSRWSSSRWHERRGAAIPPIEVYRVGGLHFVSDGHHRVSIAAATGQQTIDAYVTEVLTTTPPRRTTQPASQVASRPA